MDITTFGLALQNIRPLPSTRDIHIPDVLLGEKMLRGGREEGQKAGEKGEKKDQVPVRFL
jgi:hypothetical protein